MNKHEKADIVMILIGYYRSSLAFFELKKYHLQVLLHWPANFDKKVPSTIEGIDFYRLQNSAGCLIKQPSVRHLSPHAQLPLGEVVEFKPGVVWNVHRKKGRWIKPEKTSHDIESSAFKGVLICSYFVDFWFL